MLGRESWKTFDHFLGKVGIQQSFPTFSTRQLDIDHLPSIWESGPKDRASCRCRRPGFKLLVSWRFRETGNTPRSETIHVLSHLPQVRAACMQMKNGMAVNGIGRWESQNAILYVHHQACILNDFCRMKPKNTLLDVYPSLRKASG